MQDTLENYLRKSYLRNAIDHSLRATVNGDGEIIFYIHPEYRDGDTLDFKVEGNKIIPLFKIDE